LVGGVPKMDYNYSASEKVVSERANPTTGGSPVYFLGLPGFKWVDSGPCSAGKQLLPLVSGGQGGLGSGAAIGTGCGVTAPNRWRAA